MGETRYEVYPLTVSQTVYQTFHPDGRIEGEVRSTHEWKWGKSRSHYYGEINCPLCKQKGYLEILKYENGDTWAFIKHLRTSRNRDQTLKTGAYKLSYCSLGRVPPSILRSLIESSRLFKEGRL